MLNEGVLNNFDELTNVVEYVMLDNSELNQIHVTHHLREVGHFALF